MPVYTDQINRSVRLETVPERIISLVPSQTELLFSLGLADKLVGRTKFCIHPREKVGEIEKVGGTKNVNTEKIIALHPDLIIANKEENPERIVRKLEKKFPVWVTDVSTVSSACEMIDDIGTITNTCEEARSIVRLIQAGFLRLKDQLDSKPLRGLYLIWKDPFMAAGHDSFISDVMHHAGIFNVLVEWKEKGLRYPKLEWEEIVNLKPDVILLSSEPYPFKDNHARLFREKTGIRTALVDGEYFSWYGSRMLKSPAYLENLSEMLRKEF